MRVGGPFPKFGSASDAPGANVFVFVCVGGFEVLAHRVWVKEIENNRVRRCGHG
jgi:hypothetical protein